MVDEAAFGKRDERGHWAPDAPIAYPPVFVWPLKLGGLGRWFLREYVFSWNLLYAAIAVVFWTYLTPDIDVLAQRTWEWPLWLLARNTVLVTVFFGLWHGWLYVQRRQGVAFKYNGVWPDQKSARFFGGTQLRENLALVFVFAVPIWTLFEVVALYAFAQGLFPFLFWSDHPLYLGVLFLMIALWREVHFYAVHRLIHWSPLYRWVHRTHHKNTNPTPWSGLAMHPVEHMLYFSGVLIHVVIPAHPVHAIFQLVHAALTPAQGHAGFDKVVLGEARAMDTHAYAHYLHHKHFECNYADGAIPLDRWFGSFCDGTPEGIAALKKRLGR